MRGGGWSRAVDSRSSAIERKAHVPRKQVVYFRCVRHIAKYHSLLTTEVADARVPYKVGTTEKRTARSTSVGRRQLQYFPAANSSPKKATIKKKKKEETSINLLVYVAIQKVNF